MSVCLRPDFKLDLMTPMISWILGPLGGRSDAASRRLHSCETSWNSSIECQTFFQTRKPGAVTRPRPHVALRCVLFFFTSRKIWVTEQDPRLPNIK